MLAAALLPCLGSAADVPYHHDISRRACCLVIAHAGGGIHGNAYTNSEEAVLANLKMGLRVFEIDFSRTRDGIWVGTHDWDGWRAQTGYDGTLPPSYREFSAAQIAMNGARYTALTIRFLERELAAYPDAVVITDTKSKYDLADLARTLRKSRLAKRVVPQAYSPADVELLQGLGYERVILTVYKMNLKDAERLVGRLAPIRGDLHALTVPLDFFNRHHARLAGLGLPLYVHGEPAKINSRALHRQLREQGAAGFYLD